uniref:DUF834 domain-containing protein n=1 Tax=Oryza rufipogon TaxID=4529 RepID=A0A0E0MUV7_ORYRU
MASPPVVWLLFSSLPLPHFRVLGTRWLQRGMLTCCERSGVLDGDGVGVGTWEDGVRNLSTSWGAAWNFHCDDESGGRVVWRHRAIATVLDE